MSKVAPHAGRAVALPAVDVERVEGVEILVAAGAGDLQRQKPAGRRLRIDIGEMREVRRQGEIAERRQAVRLDDLVGERRDRARDAIAASAPAPPALSAALARKHPDHEINSA